MGKPPGVGPGPPELKATNRAVAPTREKILERIEDAPPAAESRTANENQLPNLCLSLRENGTGVIS
jgi:hypothetical protein